MSATRSHSLSIGIVGLPNAGKSTLFNSITHNSVPAENFPFTTIDKNVGVVEVPDARLKALNDFYKAQKTVPSAITYVDIAGLVEGASKGEGLGNQFLSHIREVDCIMYVLRAFSSENIAHVYSRVSPKEDFEIVQSELILKDIESVNKKLDDARKRARPGMTPELEVELSALEKCFNWLNDGKPVIELELTAEESLAVKELWLLSNKPRIYVLNTRAGTDDQLIDSWESGLKEAIPQTDHKFVLRVDVKLVGELTLMDEAGQAEYIEMLGERPNMVEDLIQIGFRRLGLITFYTGSEKEVNAWSIQAGASAKAAAGVIHTDLEHGFVTADVVNVSKLIESGGFSKAKEAGLVKNKSKDYIVEDGDYIVVYSSK